MKRVVNNQTDNNREAMPPSLDEETRRKNAVINLFAIVGLTITLVLGVVALFNRDGHLSTVLFTASFAFGISKLLLLSPHKKRCSSLAPIVLVVCLMSLMIYLIIDGGVANTGPLWIYIVPPVAMFLAGMRKGVLSVLIFMAVCTGILFYPIEIFPVAHYTTEFKLRLLFSFATVTFLSAYYEHSRQTSFSIVKRMSEQFEEMAANDSLTQLKNRRGIHQFIHFVLSQAKRKQRPVSIILCDIDRFKCINDEYGHDGGDLVLKHVAQFFQDAVRSQDEVSRWGGEEFLFVLPETGEDNAFLLADKIRQRLAQSTISLKQHDIAITASFGVAQLNSDFDLNKALFLADKALYKAKEAGRNQTIRGSLL